MDLIYVILSVFLRLSPAVRKVSTVSSGRKGRRLDVTELAFWIPLVGWVSVSVQHQPNAKWLVWRVREVNDFHFSMLSPDQEQSRISDSKIRGKLPRRKLPDQPGKSNRNAD